jgi:hypothetical protein
MCFSISHDWNAESFLAEINDKDVVVQRCKHTRYSNVLRMYKFSNDLSCVSGRCTFRYLV